MSPMGSLRQTAPLLAAVLSMACGAGSGNPTQCNPLGSSAATIQLGTVIGAGKHADGTIYVADRLGDDSRVFVSSGTTLQRRRIAGSGQLGSTAYVFTISDEPAFILKIEVSSGSASRMGVIRGAFAGRDFEIGQQGDVLEVLPADAVAGMTVANLPGEVFVEYAASLPDGRHLVVVRPNDDWTYEDFRLFLGTPERMLERHVLSVSRGRDGGTTHIDFVEDGATVQAYFPSPIGGPSYPPPSLTEGDRQSVLTLLGSDAAPAHTYFCGG